MKQQHFRLLALLLAAVLFCTALAGCGRKDDSGSDALSLSEQLDLGSRYLTDLDYENAVIAFTAAIELDPQNTEAYAALYAIYQAQGKTDEANAIWQQMQESGVSGTDMVEQVLDKANIIHEAGGNGLSVDLAVAGKALEEGLYREAKDAFLAALEKDEANKDAYAGLYVCASLLNEDTDGVLDRAGKYGLGAEDLANGVEYYADLAGAKVTLPEPEENGSENQDNGEENGKEADDENGTGTQGTVSAAGTSATPAAPASPAAAPAEPAPAEPAPAEPAPAEPAPAEPAPPETTPPSDNPTGRPDLPWLATYKVDYTQFEVVSGSETPLPWPGLLSVGDPVRSYTGPTLQGWNETTVENGMEVTRWYNADGAVYNMYGQNTLGDGSVRTTYFTPQGAARYYTITQTQAVGDPRTYEETYVTRYTMDGRVLEDTVIRAYTYGANGRMIRYDEYDADYQWVCTRVYTHDAQGNTLQVETTSDGSTTFYNPGISESVYGEDGSYTVTWNAYNSSTNTYQPNRRTYYSSDGRLSMEYMLNADGTVRTTNIYTYDRANGSSTTTTYDGVYAAGAVPTRIWTVCTDKHGNTIYTEGRDGAGAVTDITVYAYNANEQQISSVSYSNSGSGMTVSNAHFYTYDEYGFQTSSTNYWSGSANSYVSVLTYDRLQNMLSETTYRQNGTLSYHYMRSYQGKKSVGFKRFDTYEDGSRSETEYDANGNEIYSISWRADGTKSSESITENGLYKTTYYEADGTTVSRYTESETLLENGTYYRHETLSIRYENGVRTEKMVSTYSGKNLVSTVTYGATDGIKLEEREYALVEGAGYSVQVKYTAYYANGNRKSYSESVPYLYTTSSGGTSVSTYTLLSVSYNEDGSESYRSEYTYDENGHQTASKYYRDGILSSSYKHQYNAVKNSVLLMEQVDYNADGSESRRCEYTYDKNGNQIAQMIYSGIWSDLYKYQYNAVKNSMLQVEAVSYKDGVEYSRTEYTYDANGNKLTEKYYSDGVLSSLYKYQYNEAAGNALLVESIGYKEDGSEASRYEYAYNAETKTNVVRRSTNYWEDGSYAVTTYDENGTYISTTQYNADGTVKTSSQSLEAAPEAPASLAAPEDALPAAAEEASPAADAPDQGADSAMDPAFAAPEEQEPETPAATAAPEEAAPAADEPEIPAAEEDAAPEEAAEAAALSGDEAPGEEAAPGSEDATGEPEATAEDDGPAAGETEAGAAESGSPSGEAPAEPEETAEDEAA